MSNSLPQSLVLIGAGKMGGAMLEGWLRIGIDPNPGRGHESRGQVWAT